MYQITDADAAVVASARTIAQETAATYATDVDANGRFPVEAMTALADQGPKMSLGATRPSANA